MSKLLKTKIKYGKKGFCDMCGQYREKNAVTKEKWFNGGSIYSRPFWVTKTTCVKCEKKFYSHSIDVVQYDEVKPDNRNCNEPIPKYTDRQFRSINSLVEAVCKEGCRQIEKFGIQTRTSFEWMSYLTEEAGELSQAISEEHYRKGSNEEVYKEAIQTATLALKIAEMYKEE